MCNYTGGPQLFALSVEMTLRLASFTPNPK